MLLALSPVVASSETHPVHFDRVATLQALATYWATQTSDIEGWLRPGNDPGYVPVVPPDSSLWSPGTPLILSPTGVRNIGSRERFIPARRVKIIGAEPSDVAVLDDLVLELDSSARFHFQDLPGILEAFGVLRAESTSSPEKLRTELARLGVQRIAIQFPDAQIHRLGLSDLKIYLEEDTSAEARRLLVNPDARFVTSAVFLKTVRLRLDTGRADPGLIGTLERLLNADLKARGDRSFELDARGVYVAIRVGRFSPAITGATPAVESTDASLTDSTKEVREMLVQLLASLEAYSTQQNQETQP